MDLFMRMSQAWERQKYLPKNGNLETTDVEKQASSQQKKPGFQLLFNCF